MPIILRPFFRETLRTRPELSESAFISWRTCHCFGMWSETPVPFKPVTKGPSLFIFYKCYNAASQKSAVLICLKLVLYGFTFDVRKQTQRLLYERVKFGIAVEGTLGKNFLHDVRPLCCKHELASPSYLVWPFRIAEKLKKRKNRVNVCAEDNGFRNIWVFDKEQFVFLLQFRLTIST